MKQHHVLRRCTFIITTISIAGFISCAEPKTPALANYNGDRFGPVRVAPTATPLATSSQNSSNISRADSPKSAQTTKSTGVTTTVNPWPAPEGTPLGQDGLIITDPEKQPIEYQIAFLDGGQTAMNDTVAVARYRYLLNSLARRTKDQVGVVADQTRRSTSVLRNDYGKRITNLEFLEQMDQMLVPGVPHMSYSDASLLLLSAMANDKEK